MTSFLGSFCRIFFAQRRKTTTVLKNCRRVVFRLKIKYNRKSATSQTELCDYRLYTVDNHPKAVAVDIPLFYPILLYSWVTYNVIYHLFVLVGWNLIFKRDKCSLRKSFRRESAGFSWVMDKSITATRITSIKQINLKIAQ